LREPAFVVAALGFREPEAAGEEVMRRRRQQHNFLYAVGLCVFDG
jgi:hypothetical protein